MKRFVEFLASMSMASLMLASCGGGNNTNASQENHSECENKCCQSALFELGNGVNVSHWLSQSDKRGEERANLITQKDFDSIAAMGFKHVRLPIDEEQLFDEQGNRLDDGMDLLHKAIKWTLDNNMNIIVDLHIVRSYHFNSENDKPNTLFSDPAAQQDFLRVWRSLQNELGQYPNDRLAYEILNEPQAPSCAAWNEFVANYIAEIRKTEPNRQLVIGSNYWQSTSSFDSLSVPANDKKLILSFHDYSPALITHYRAPWTVQKDFKGDVQYPGFSIPDTSIYANMKPEEANMLRGVNKESNKEILEKEIMTAIKAADSLGLQLYCGEFGVYPNYINPEIRFRWYNDMVSIFREHKIANAHWCYKGDFPIVKEDGTRNELPAILTK
ncbi:MAG: glycoside hydrolase family 5 protein [Paludibacteraceae bacterium]|nr:glycoside hydrolase family 5 protein [Paludibacteraceae bacterium]